MPGLDDYCSACEQPLGPERHAEHLATRIGRCFVRTHPVPACIEGARTKLDGIPVDPGPDDVEKAKIKRKTPAQGELPHNDQ